MCLQKLRKLNMADIIAIVEDDSLGGNIDVITGAGSELSDGGLPMLTSSTVSNPAVLESMSDIGNVDTTTLDNGAILVYKTTTSKWVSTTTLEAQNLEGGFY